VKVTKTGTSTASVQFTGKGAGVVTITATCEGATGMAIVTYASD
jgi:hypothetical protein